MSSAHYRDPTGSVVEPLPTEDLLVLSCTWPLLKQSTDSSLKSFDTVMRQ